MQWVQWVVEGALTTCGRVPQHWGQGIAAKYMHGFVTPLAPKHMDGMDDMTGPRALIQTAGVSETGSFTRVHLCTTI